METASTIYGLRVVAAGVAKILSHGDGGVRFMKASEIGGTSGGTSPMSADSF